jgi:hypothetical protein
MPDPAPAEPTVLRDLRYATAGGVDLHLDLHLPATRPAPLCVYLHGGGWMRGARTDRAAERLVPVARAGVAVASVDYRLSGQAVFPAPLDDVRAAGRRPRGGPGGGGRRRRARPGRRPDRRLGCLGRRSPRRAAGAHRRRAGRRAR